MTTTTTAAVRRFITTNATPGTLDDSHPQFLSFTAGNGRTISIFVKTNGGFENGYAYRGDTCLGQYSTMKSLDRACHA